MGFIDELKRLARPYEDEDDEDYEEDYEPVTRGDRAERREKSASAIADHLREKRTVVLNLESTNKEIPRRLLDFLSGVAYANEGKIKKVAISTYIITPYNVDILGDLIDELENNGLYF